MRRELNIIIKLEIMFGSRFMTLPREMTSSMVLIKFKRQEQMELLLLLEMKKAMFWKPITLENWNLTKANLLNPDQELYIRRKVKLITSLFTNSLLNSCLHFWLKDLLLVGKSVASLGACPTCPLYHTRSFYSCFNLKGARRVF